MINCRQYYVLTLSPAMPSVFAWIEQHDIQYEIHLNRTRFWVPEGVMLTEFLLRFADSCPLVDDSMDLASGLPKTDSRYL